MSIINTKNKEYFSDNVSLKGFSDEEVLSLSLSKPNVFSEIVLRYEDAFLRKAKRIFGTGIEAEYSVQDAFVKIYINAGKFKKMEGAKFSSWAYKILLNTCFEYYKKARREQEFVCFLDSDELSVFKDESDGFERERARDKVLFLVSKLPNLLRAVANLHFIDYKSQKEIAVILGISNEAVRTRIYRAKKVLKEISEATLN